MTRTMDGDGNGGDGDGNDNEMVLMAIAVTDIQEKVALSAKHLPAPQQSDEYDLVI